MDPQNGWKGESSSDVIASRHSYGMHSVSRTARTQAGRRRWDRARPPRAAGGIQPLAMRKSVVPRVYSNPVVPSWYQQDISCSQTQTSVLPFPSPSHLLSCRPRPRADTQPTHRVAARSHNPNKLLCGPSGRFAPLLPRRARSHRHPRHRHRSCHRYSHTQSAPCYGTPRMRRRTAGGAGMRRRRS